MQFFIYTAHISPRSEYIISTLFNALGIQDFIITDDISFYHQSGAIKINYSYNSIDESEFRITPVSILFEAGIKHQSIECFQWDELSAFYQTSSSDFPFDIFAASFYLITRYEEYLPHQLDSYGRYAHENSVAFREKFLHLPLVNLWLQKFKQALQQKFPLLTFQRKPFTFIPTYDIDIAWSYVGKGILRNAVGGLRSLIKGEGSVLKERLSVLLGNQKDPFDIYDWLDDLHTKHNLNPVYFFLLAEKQVGYDKNISPSNKQLQQLIKKHSKKYEVGIHPSWQSGDDVSLLRSELEQLKSIANKEVNTSRQHYIRLKLPETYQQLIAAGIEKDFSMGYGSINGFRASYCLPYKWYDLEKEETTSLTVYPFCFMEANSYYEQHYTLQQAKEELGHYIKITKLVDGMLITIMHNHLLGDEQLFKGWREIVRTGMTEICGIDGISKC